MFSSIKNPLKWTRFSPVEIRVQAAKDDANDAITILSKSIYSVGISEQQRFEIIASHIANDGFIKEIKKTLYQNKDYQCKTHLAYFALADQSIATIVFSEPAFILLLFREDKQAILSQYEHDPSFILSAYPQLTTLEKLTQLERHQDNENLIDQLLAKTDLYQFKMTLLNIVLEDQSEDKSFSRRLIFLPKLYQEFSPLEKVKLNALAFPAKNANEKRRIVNHINDEALKHVEAADLVFKTEFILQELSNEDMINIICQHASHQDFRETIQARLASIHLSLFEFARESRFFADLIFAHPDLPRLLSDEERYQLGLHYDNDFCIRNFNTIIFDASRFSSDHVQDKFQAFMQYNQEVFSRLSNDDLVLIICQYRQDQNFINNFIFCAMQAKPSLDKRIFDESFFSSRFFPSRSDDQFFIRLLEEKFSEILKMLTAADILKQAKRTKTLLFQHLPVFLDIALNKAEEVHAVVEKECELKKVNEKKKDELIKTKKSEQMLLWLNDNDFFNAVIETMEEAKKTCNTDDCVWLLCKKIGSIKRASYLEDQSKNTNYKKICGMMIEYIEKIAVDNQHFKTRVISDPDMNALFDYKSQDVIDMRSHSMFFEKVPTFAPASEEGLRYCAQMEDHLKGAVFSAISDINLARAFLADGNLASHCPYEDLMTILIAHIENKSFRTDLQNGKLGSKKYPINVLCIAELDQEACKLVLNNETMCQYLGKDRVNCLRAKLPAQQHSDDDFNDEDRKYYAILGLSTDATAKEIAKRYHQLARELHPDKNPDTDTVEQFRNLKEAYEKLFSKVSEREQIKLSPQ